MKSKPSPTPKKASKVLSFDRTYRALAAEAIEASSAKALDLHGLYDEILSLYPQLRNEEQVDWKNSIRHCLSINNEFIRVTRDIFRSRACRSKCGEEPRSYWTTANCLSQYGWRKYAHSSSANIRKLEKLQLDKTETKPETKDWKPPQPAPKKQKTASNLIEEHVPVALPDSRLPMLWPRGLTAPVLLESPGTFVSVIDAGSLSSSSPLALDVATQSALYNIAVIDEEDRQSRLRERLRTIDPALATLLGPTKMRELIVQSNSKTEPAKLLSPLRHCIAPSNPKSVSNESSPNLSTVSLPPIFNHAL